MTATDSVKPTLTGRPRRRSRRHRENPDYAAFARRIVQAHGRRVADGDIEGLADLARLAEDVDTALTAAVVGLADRGYTWAEIGARLGITRQAAHQRFAREVSRDGRATPR
ncbi:hypothetical protein [Pseudonocardia sp. WMMC193]|uniref:hypothetical protein n=1 Tax=Pseudonocardia sp. WMMC193 TaxID=2911965 RepID=UPI001F4662DB|nr:hypothetical protein [Pseudonocardia sp. WMMC193]MCF7550995.1 hypothetical protein [Pseudonocardia sp. WMMC193]